MTEIEIRHRSYYSDEPTTTEGIKEEALEALEKHRIEVFEIIENAESVIMKVQPLYLSELVASYPWEMQETFLFISINEQTELSFDTRQT